MAFFNLHTYYSINFLTCQEFFQLFSSFFEPRTRTTYCLGEDLLRAFFSVGVPPPTSLEQLYISISRLNCQAFWEKNIYTFFWIFIRKNPRLSQKIKIVPFAAAKGTQTKKGVYPLYASSFATSVQSSQLSVINSIAHSVATHSLGML